jgi:hypothetical protein
VALLAVVGAPVYLSNIVINRKLELAEGPSHPALYVSDGGLYCSNVAVIAKGDHAQGFMLRNARAFISGACQLAQLPDPAWRHSLPALS